MGRRTWQLILTILVGAPGVGEGANLCLAPPDTLGVSVSADCVIPVPNVYDNAWFGYETGDSALCESTPVRPSEDCFWSQSCYQWSISSSSTDPGVRRGPIVDGKLYLWFECNDALDMNCTGDGIMSAGFSLTGTLQVVSFTPRDNFLNAGTLPDLLLAAGGCPQPPIVAGEIEVQDPSPVGRNTWGRAKAAYR